jgi:hypothetical protein
MKKRIYLTFDCEDFINDRSLLSLKIILKLLEKYTMKGIFFLTGHMAEKIEGNFEIIDMIKKHEIGYHSTSHTVRPTVLEFTDCESYLEAIQISLQRETSYINPITGNPEGIGGIDKVRNVFQNKKVECYRGPGFSFSPPHLEALKELGIKYDFTTNLASTPILFKDVTFYPYPDLFENFSRRSFYTISLSLHRYGLSVFNFHPNSYVNDSYWDMIYFSHNPAKLDVVKPKKHYKQNILLKKFKGLIMILKFLKNTNLVEVKSKPEKGNLMLHIDECRIRDCFARSTYWVKNKLNYYPKNQWNHFKEFFDLK